MICELCSGFNGKKVQVKMSDRTEKLEKSEMTDRDLRKRELNGPGHKMT